jgi:hypothetical protein
MEVLLDGAMFGRLPGKAATPVEKLGKATPGRRTASRRDPHAVTVALIKFGTQALWPNDDL